MGLFEKFKNIFTEEVEEEVPIKKEVVQVEIPAPKLEEEKPVRSIPPLRSQPPKSVEIVEPPEPKKEEKFVFPVYFDDKDFETIEPKKEVKKEEVTPRRNQEPKREIYGGNTPAKPKVEKQEKKFVPSPVISPVYGILDKNYKKEEIIPRVNTSKSEYHKPKELNLEDVRKKAFGTLEDELENSLFQDDPIYMEREPDYFEEMGFRTKKKEESVEVPIHDTNVDDAFKEHAIEEQPEKFSREDEDWKQTNFEEEEPVRKLETMEEESRLKRAENSFAVEEEHSQQIEEEFYQSFEKPKELEKSPIEMVEDGIIDTYKQERRKTDVEDNMTLDALNQLTEEEEDLNFTESDLFNLIDTMYDKGDEENGATF